MEDNNDTGDVFLELAKNFKLILDEIFFKKNSLNEQFYFSNVLSQIERNA